MTSTAAYSNNTQTGNDLLADCQSPDDGGGGSVNVAFCRGYVLGIAGASPLVCALNGVVTASQLAKVVVRYLNAHPENLHESATDLTTRAFMTAWPCK
jgi:hypothetical protein